MRLFIVLLFASLCYASGDGSTMMRSTAPEIKMGVWDKMGEFGDYFEVTFVVKNGKGKTYTAKRRGNSEWVYAFFPSDFITWAEPGKYTWQAYIGGKLRAWDCFEIVDNSTIRTSK